MGKAKKEGTKTSGEKPATVAGSRTMTVSQALAGFAAWLPKPNNYPRIVRPYLLFCLTNQYTIDRASLRLFAADLPANRVSPLRKFLLFYHTHGIGRLLPDPTPASAMIPEADKLILAFLRDSTTLRGEESKQTYTKSLHAFFGYVAREQLDGRPAAFNGPTVGRYVEELKREGLSAFTINIRLSAIRQMAAWVIRNPAQVELTPEQVDSLRAVAAVRSLTTEQKIYKDTLEGAERAALLDALTDLTDRAIVVLLVLEGLRTVEVTRLRVGDIDFGQGRLWVRGAGENAGQDIHLFEDCARALRLYLQQVGYWPTSEYADKLLFDGVKTYQIRHRVDKYLKQLGLKRPRISAHSLRHTAGHLLIQAGAELGYVQRHLRLELPESTQLYVQKQPKGTGQPEGMDDGVGPQDN